MYNETTHSFSLSLPLEQFLARQLCIFTETNLVVCGCFMVVFLLVILMIMLCTDYYCMCLVLAIVVQYDFSEDSPRTETCRRLICNDKGGILMRCAVMLCFFKLNQINCYSQCAAKVQCYLSTLKCICLHLDQRHFVF